MAGNGIKQMGFRWLPQVLLCCVLLLTSCGSSWQELGDIPYLPQELSEVPGILDELGLGDLTGQVDLSQLPLLPSLATPPGAINFNGPTGQTIELGSTIPGTTISLVEITESAAIFTIGGLRTEKRIGDALDFDGSWPQLPDITYNLRLRIFYIGSETVRAVGAHQLLIPSIAPQIAPPNTALGGYQLTFTYLDANVNINEAIAGTTFVYLGSGDNGAQFGGLGQDEYPYRKIGESLHWLGRVRQEIAAEFNLRVATYTADSAHMVGTVTVAMPTK